MAGTRAVWGIDLGQSALKAIALRVAGDQVEVVDHAYVEHEKILSQPEVDREALIEQTVGKFLEGRNLSNDKIAVAVPGQHTLARFSPLPPVDKKKVPELVKYEAQQQIPFDMEEVIWDYQTFEDRDTSEIKVGIFAMRRELLREHLKFLSSNTLEPTTVQSAPLALYNALRFDGLCGDRPVVILDIGAQNTDLIVADSDNLWTRNIPIGGNNFTEALIKTFKLSFRKAEKLKREAQKHKYARQIFQAMRPVFADLVAEIQRSIGFFTSSRRGVKLSKVIAMGNAFQLPGMVKFVQQNLSMDVDRPTRFNRLSVSHAPRAPELIAQLMSFGVAYGLALQELGKAPITSNLLPTEIAKQVVWRRKTPWFYGAAACLALAAGVVAARNMADQRALASGTGGEDRQAPAVVSIEDAYRIVESGADASLPPKLIAKQVSETGRTLEQALAAAEGGNQQEIARIAEVSKLQTCKVIWPKIMHMIHSSLPAPDPALAKALADGPVAYTQLIQKEPAKYARSKRKLIFIQSLQAQPAQDVKSMFRAAKSGGSTAADMPAMSTATNPDAAGASGLGFVISIVGRTPYEGSAAFVNGTFVANLQKASEKDETLYIDAVRLNWCDPVKDRTGGGSTVSVARPLAYGAPRGYIAEEPGFPVSAGMSVAGDMAADRDPVTGESVANDYEFELVIGIILGKKPAVAEGTPAAPAEPGGPVEPAGPTEPPAPKKPDAPMDVPM